MSQYLSDKIKVLSFMLIILVLYIHSSFHDVEIDGMFWNKFIQEFISSNIGRLAIPLFYIISGYLFFLNTDNGIVSIKRKIKSRVATILLPYIYGCVFYVLFLSILKVIPGVSNYINSNIIFYIQ